MSLVYFLIICASLGIAFCKPGAPSNEKATHMCRNEIINNGWIQSRGENHHQGEVICHPGFQPIYVGRKLLCKDGKWNADVECLPSKTLIRRRRDIDDSLSSETTSQTLSSEITSQTLSSSLTQTTIPRSKSTTTIKPSTKPTTVPTIRSTTASTKHMPTTTTTEAPDDPSSKPVSPPLNSSLGCPSEPSNLVMVLSICLAVLLLLLVVIVACVVRDVRRKKHSESPRLNYQKKEAEAVVLVEVADGKHETPAETDAIDSKPSEPRAGSNGECQSSDQTPPTQDATMDKSEVSSEQTKNTTSATGAKVIPLCGHPSPPLEEPKAGIETQADHQEETKTLPQEEAKESESFPPAPEVSVLKSAPEPETKEEIPQDMKKDISGGQEEQTKEGIIPGTN